MVEGRDFGIDGVASRRLALPARLHAMKSISLRHASVDFVAPLVAEIRAQMRSQSALVSFNPECAHFASIDDAIFGGEFVGGVVAFDPAFHAGGRLHIALRRP